MRLSIAIAMVMFGLLCVCVPPALAGDGLTGPVWQPGTDGAGRSRAWDVTWSTAAPDQAPPSAVIPVDLTTRETADQTTSGRPRAVAFEYSDGYKTRAKVHKIASIATLPLFISQYVVGQKLYDRTAGEDSGYKGVHSALAASTAVLFGVNSVTGVWNLMEGRRNPNRSKLKSAHGILMLVADAGFVATGLTAPGENEREDGVLQGGGGGKRSTHRAIALTSMGIATISYLMMLFGGR